MNKTKVLIFGSSGHSKVVIDIFEKYENIEIIGLIDGNKVIGEEILGYKIIGNEEDLPVIMEKFPDTQFFIAIGDNWIRNKVHYKILTNYSKANFISAIHPSAQIGKNVSIGLGAVIMAGAVVNSDSQIGDFTIINTNSSLDHDSVMGDFSSLAPNVAVGGNVNIGCFSAISIAATIIHGLKIGEHTIVGAGSLVLKDLDPKYVYYGIPANKIRARKIGEKYS